MTTGPSMRLAPCQPRCVINLGNLVSAEDPPAQCASQMTLETLVKMFDVVYNNSTDVNNGYDETYGVPCDLH
jgi:hypothetical protein